MLHTVSIFLRRIVTHCFQVPKPIKLLASIRNGRNGAFIRSTAILWTNGQLFILLRSVGVYGKPSPVEHLRIYILCPYRFTAQC